MKLDRIYHRAVAVIEFQFFVKLQQQTEQTEICTYRVKWRHIINGHDTIAILWV